MSFSKFCLEIVRDLSHCHKIPLKTQKAILSKKNAQRLLAKSEVLLQSFLRGTSTAKATRFVAVPRGGHLLTQKMSLCLLNIKSYMEPHPTTNRQSCFKHQIFSESNKNCKILQNTQKKGTHEVSGHFDTIEPNFNPPTAELELPTATVTKTSNLRSEPMDGLKIPPKGSTSNFKSNRHRLTGHQLSNGEIKPPGGENL